MDSERLIFCLKDDPGFVDGRSFASRGLGMVPSDAVALTLEQSSIGDADLEALPSLPNLRCLDLDGTAITDQALTALWRFPLLEELWLECTDISDDGLNTLRSVRSLRFVSVAYTAVTPAGIAGLKAALPSIEVSK
jgi:hypothetical protein